MPYQPEPEDEIREESTAAIPVEEYLTDPGELLEGDDVEDPFGGALECDNCERPSRPVILHRDPPGAFATLLCPSCYDWLATRAAEEA